MTEPRHLAVACEGLGDNQKVLDAEIEARLRAGWIEVTNHPAYAPRIEGVRRFNAPEPWPEWSGKMDAFGPPRSAVLERNGGDARLARVYLDAARRLLPEVRAHDAALGPTAMYLDETTAGRRAVLDLLDEADAANAELRRQADRVAQVIAQRDAAWAREGELATALREVRDELAALKGGAGTSEASRA